MEINIFQNPVVMWVHQLFVCFFEFFLKLFRYCADIQVVWLRTDLNSTKLEIEGNQITQLIIYYLNRNFRIDFNFSVVTTFNT